MNESKPNYTSPESEVTQLRFAEGWREILEAPDALDYQILLSDLTDLSLQRIGEESAGLSKETVLGAWQRAIEQVADVTVDPEDMAKMTQAEIVETALIVLKTNVEPMEWNDEGLIFTVPNMFSEQDATIDIKELLGIRRIHSSEISSEHNETLMSDAVLLKNDERIPPGYSVFQTEVRLLNGRIESAFYSTREGKMPDPKAWERSSSSITEGFIWALTVPEFADQETEDDDRALEIGNMMSYAISQGLTKEQVLECYKQAFAIAKSKA